MRWEGPWRIRKSWSDKLPVKAPAQVHYCLSKSNIDCRKRIRDSAACHVNHVPCAIPARWPQAAKWCCRNHAIHAELPQNTLCSPLQQIHKDAEDSNVHQICSFAKPIESHMSFPCKASYLWEETSESKFRSLLPTALTVLNLTEQRIALCISCLGPAAFPTQHYPPFAWYFRAPSPILSLQFCQLCWCQALANLVSLQTASWAAGAKCKSFKRWLFLPLWFPSAFRLGRAVDPHRFCALRFSPQEWVELL